MDPGRRAFLEKYGGLWSQRAASRRASGDPIDAAIAAALDRIAGEMLAELASAPVPERPARDPSGDAITWRSPVFNVGGRFNPFAGTKREGWLASADVCDRMGYGAVAEGYRRMAAAVDPDELPDFTAGEDAAPDVPAATRPPPRRWRSTWTGMPMPPPEPTPFAAGPQMSFL